MKIVQAISGREAAAAATALSKAGGEVKPAVLLASGVPSLREATALLAKNKGHLRGALEHLAET